MNLPPNTVKLFGDDFVTSFEVTTATAFGTVNSVVTTDDKVPLSVQQDIASGWVVIRVLGGTDALYTFSLVNFVAIRPIEFIVEDDILDDEERWPYA